MHPEFCIVCDFPEHIKVDERNRPHCVDGPSHLWRGGMEAYYIHGVRVDKRIVMQPETITVDEIEAERNLEVQRVMMDLYGLGKYLADTGARVIDEDIDNLGQPRTLYIKDRKGKNPLVFVQVVNSTAEPDGSFKKYFLRVNHECRPLFLNESTGEYRRGAPQKMTCHNAVASTFGKYGHEYSPEVET